MSGLEDLLRIPAISVILGGLITLAGQYFLKNREQHEKNRELLRKKLEMIYKVTLDYEEWLCKHDIQSNKPEPNKELSMLITLYATELRPYVPELNKLTYNRAMKVKVYSDTVFSGTIVTKDEVEKLKKEVEGAELEIAQFLYKLREGIESLAKSRLVV
ncbi:MAG: hypothetical protein AAGU11_09130 [Syntrophobacteraceae bacterium]